MRVSDIENFSYYIYYINLHCLLPRLYSKIRIIYDTNIEAIKLIASMH